MERTVDAAIAVLVSLADHLVNLIVSELLANGCHDVAQLSSGDEAIVVTVEHLNIVVSHVLPGEGRLCCWWNLTLKASRISSSESVSFIFLAIIVRNSTAQSASKYT